jgi:hypothetical protein
MISYIQTVWHILTFCHISVVRSVMFPGRICNWVLLLHNPLECSLDDSALMVRILKPEHREGWLEKHEWIGFGDRSVNSTKVMWTLLADQLRTSWGNRLYRRNGHKELICNVPTDKNENKLGHKSSKRKTGECALSNISSVSAAAVSSWWSVTHYILRHQSHILQKIPFHYASEIVCLYTIWNTVGDSRLISLLFSPKTAILSRTMSTV